MHSNSFTALSFEAGQVRFAGLVRGSDEGLHDIFVVSLSGYSMMYGEWRNKWADNGNDFDIEIVSFGFLDPRSVGIPGARQIFPREERLIIEDLVRALFASDEVRSEAIPTTKFCSRFLGRVHFLPKWIREAGTFD